LVHIKKVEIFGFKSFGFRNTVVGFERGLVSISGPNGSGKSNILDAITFAMGENRPKVMRVDRLRSLIHDIEGQRRGPRLARVNVTFDNSDRKIPVDSDTVDIAREMSGDGENTYYLNKKQTNRTRILDLLDVANAGLSQLNAVQQGTVTRISEFSSEEKRQTIEDLVGLSYFDEKKTEAIKQLDDADVRLEVALAKMGEIKKRIDELEEERNQKLRHDMLESEIRRLEAVSAAGRLREVRASESAKRDELLAVTDEAARLGAEHERIRQDIAKLESEKSGFMEKADAYNRAKAELDSELSRIVREYEQAGGALAASQRRISQIDGRIPEIEEALLGHDAVAFAGAIGQPDSHSGELPCAYGALVDCATVTPAELLEHCKVHVHERAPQPKHITILPELPKTAVGKVFKPDLRKDAIIRIYNAALEEKSLPARVVSVVDDKKRGLVAQLERNGADEGDVAGVLGDYTRPWEWAA